MAPASFTAGQIGPTTAYAQTAVAPSVAVVGEGTAKAQPDAATVRLGVQVTTPSPAEALAQTRQATDRLLEQLRGLGVLDADLQTTNLNVYPITAPGRDGTPPDPTQVSGYRGMATVVVQNQDLARVSSLLESAVQAGVTSVQGVTFGFRDAARLHREALGTAITSARQEAEASAAAAGMRLGGIRAVQELNGNVPAPVLQGTGLGGGVGGGGIAPGEIAVTARVQVTFDATV
jgi:uncharacterized protein YggE